MVRFSYTALDCVLFGSNASLHGQVLLCSLQLSVEELGVVLPFCILVLLCLLCSLFFHPTCSLLITPVSICHHLSQLCLFLRIAQLLGCRGNSRSVVLSLVLWTFLFPSSIRASSSESWRS